MPSELKIRSCSNSGDTCHIIYEGEYDIVATDSSPDPIVAVELTLQPDTTYTLFVIVKYINEEEFTSEEISASKYCNIVEDAHT